MMRSQITAETICDELGGEMKETQITGWQETERMCVVESWGDTGTALISDHGDLAPEGVTVYTGRYNETPAFVDLDVTSETRVESPQELYQMNETDFHLKDEDSWGAVITNPDLL